MAGDKNQQTQKVKDTLEWIGVFVVAIVAAFLINSFIIVNAVIPTASMENTIMTGDRIVGNRLAYIKNTPKRGDIVVFKFPDDEKQLFIKRIIGEPGDTVEIIEGKVYINGAKEPLDESSYLRETPFGDFGPYEVPAESYFVMGDNRNYSYDARFWNNTYVSSSKILGKAALKYYPKIEKLSNK